jgi:hypothetical protein
MQNADIIDINLPRRHPTAVIETGMNAANENAPVGALDRVVWREELRQRLAVSSRTLTRYIEVGRVPEPETFLTRQRYGWHASTLRRLGFL